MVTGVAAGRCAVRPGPSPRGVSRAGRRGSRARSGRTGRSWRRGRPWSRTRSTLSAPAVASSSASLHAARPCTSAVPARGGHPPPPYRPTRGPGEVVVTHDPDRRNSASSNGGILPTPCEGAAATGKCCHHASPDRRGRRRHRHAPRQGPRARGPRRRPGRDRRRRARRTARPVDFDVVLLDLGLPDRDGFDVCRELRARSDVPIIVVTARSEEVDRVVGLELGADDYIVKPFGFRELVARIRAVARRRAPRRRAPRPGRRRRRQRHDGGEHGSVVEVGTLTVDRRTRRVTVDGDPVALTPKEFDLLAFLADDAGAVRAAAGAARERVGPALVRAHQDARRARRVAAQEARRPGMDRDGARRRVPAARRSPSDGGCREAAPALQLPLDHRVRPARARDPARRVVRELGRAPAHQRPPARRVLARDPVAGAARPADAGAAAARRAPCRRSPTATTRTPVDAS